MSNLLLIAAFVGALAAGYVAYRRWRSRGHAGFGSGSAGELRAAEAGRRLLAATDLTHVLEAIVEGACQVSRAERAILRLYNARTRLFEPRAFSGCDDRLIRELSNADVLADRFGPRNHGPEAQFLVDPAPFSGAGIPDRHLCRERSGGLFVCFLPSKGEGASGYLALEIPAGEDVGWPRRQRRGLATLASMASIAIEAARLRGNLEQKGVELSLASEKLKDVQRLKDNFVGVVSHELRTPLTSIKAYAEMMSRALESARPETVTEFTRVILNESNRLDQVFNDILKVSELENGRPRLVTDELDLMAFLRELLEEQRDLFRQAELSLALEASTESLMLRADRGGLREVLVHVLENARKFTEGGGHVVVRVRHGVSAVRLEVEDDGLGIPQPEVNRVFERFHQVDDGSTRRFGGQGLGLTICRDIVRRHGGQIWAEAVPEGGTRVIVLLPSKGVVIQPTQLKRLESSERIHREEFLHLVISFVAETMQVHTTSLMLVDPEEERLYVEAAVGLADDIVRSVRVRRGEGFAGYVWETRESLLVSDITADPRFAGRINHAQYWRNSLLSVPILRDGECIGVLNVNNKNNGDDCLEEDRLILESIAERIEHSLRDFEEFRLGHRGLAADNAALSAIIDFGRSRGGLLSQRLRRLGFEVGRELGLGEDGLRELGLGLRVYDLGLSSVDAEILRKVTPLTASERKSLDEHVEVGTELAQGLGLSPGVLKLLAHHHENFNGTGYPDGLSGEAIPLGARIVRLVDSAQGALTDRPGRGAWELDELEQLIERESGRVFCPRVAPIFLRLLREGREDLERLIQAPGNTQRTSEEPELAGAPKGS